MRIVAAIGNDEGIFGQVGGGKIGGKFRKGDRILRLRGSVLHVGQVCERIVAHQVFGCVTSRIPGVR